MRKCENVKIWKSENVKILKLWYQILACDWNIGKIRKNEKKLRNNVKNVIKCENF